MSTIKKCTKNKDKRNRKSYNVFVTHTITHGSDCPMNKSIHESKEICNRLRENNLMSAISEYALGYIMSILITAFSCGYRGKTVDIARNSDRHRTSISRFLTGDKWDDSAFEDAMRKSLSTT